MRSKGSWSLIWCSSSFAYSWVCISNEDVIEWGIQRRVFKIWFILWGSWGLIWTTCRVSWMSAELFLLLGFRLRLCHDYQTGLQATYPSCGMSFLVLTIHCIFNAFQMFLCQFQSNGVTGSLLRFDWWFLKFP